ncbi:MAG: hypothetical protein K9L79_00510 [Methylobacter tundripaludum]|nr:hypothetical protein [Methylobacter tundripaludum]
MKQTLITLTLTIIAAIGGYIAYPLLHPAPTETAATNDIEIVPAAPSSGESTVDYPHGVNQSDPNNYAQVLQLAKHGNYQAQRNVAWGFAEQPYNGQEKNSVLGCAWYLVVLNSGNPKVDIGDQGNAKVYCGKLDKGLQEAAAMFAQQFLTEIADNTKFGKLD